MIWSLENDGWECPGREDTGGKSGDELCTCDGQLSQCSQCSQCSMNKMHQVEL
jgi:hypothetical protein